MAKRTGFIVACLLAVGSVQAALVSPEEAQQIAQEYMRSQKSYIGRRSPARLQLQDVRRKVNSEEAAYYVFGTEEAGFVFVSADDQARPILGHVHEGTYDERRIPRNMRAWLTFLTEELSNIPNSQLDRPRKALQHTPVDPLLEIEGIRWDQSEPYNNACPEKDGVRCPTGCVATAAAQIMRYYKYPAKGRGSHSYVWNGETLSSNFGQHTYNWDYILADYSGSYTQTQADEVALLMSDVGIALEMDYSPGASSSNDFIAALSMVEHFRFDSAMQMLYMNDMGSEAFEKRVAKELKAKRPVMMSGRTDSDSGHEFICDGVNSDDLFHINWGWGGWYNGDFALTALYPDGQGIGGALQGEGYTHDVRALVGLQPDKGNSPVPQIEVESMIIPEGKTSFGRQEEFSIQMNELWNMGIFPWTGYLGFVVYDEDDDIVSEFWADDYAITMNMLNGYTYYTSASNVLSSKVKSGTYTIVAAYTFSLNNKEWIPITYFDGSTAGLEIEVTNSTITFTELEKEQGQVEKYIGAMSIQRLNKETRRFSWSPDTKADHYVVNVFIESGNQYYLFSSDTVEETRVSVPFYYPDKLVYSWSVQAFDKNDKLLAQCLGENFEVEVTTDYTPYGLNHEVQSDGILFRWKGDAPAYQFELYFDGELTWRQFPEETRIFIPLKADGLYEWNVRSLCQSKQLFVSEAVKDAFNMPENEGIEILRTQDQQGKFIQNGLLYIRKENNTYDVLGR